MQGKRVARIKLTSHFPFRMLLSGHGFKKRKSTVECINENYDITDCMLAKIQTDFCHTTDHL